MLHQLKLLCLAIIWGVTHIHGTNQEKLQKNACKVAQKINYLLQKSNDAINLFQVEGYLRLFASFHGLVGIRKLISNYVGTTDYYPYIDMKLRSSKNILAENMLEEKVCKYIVSPIGKCAKIQDNNLYFSSLTKGNLQISGYKASFITGNNHDQLYSLFQLKSNNLNFAFLILTKAGALFYTCLPPGSTFSHNTLPILVDYFGKLTSNASQKISFCHGKQPLTFLILLNSPTPVLQFYKKSIKRSQAKRFEVVNFNTSDWLKNNQSSCDDLHFLDDKHFMILNDSRKVGGRVFLYSLDNQVPLGFIALKKSYNILRRIAHDKLYVFSEKTSCMMVWNHHIEGFVDVKGTSNLCNPFTVQKTQQLVMSDKNHSRKFYLCKLMGKKLMIQKKFQFSRSKKGSMTGMYWKEAAHEQCLKVTTVRDSAINNKSYTKKIFNLVKKRAIKPLL